MSAKKKKVYGSIASYHQPEGTMRCDLEKLAKVYSKSYGNVPKTMTDVRAMEITLLAKAYLKVLEELGVKHK